MKELSIEEKAKRYDEILAMAEGAKLPYYKENIMSKVKEFVDYLIPELKESEDERIRNRLIAMCKHYIECYALDPYNINGYKEALAWLEKQGKNNMGIFEATKKKLEDNLNKALEKETPESWNEFLEKQGDQKTIKEHNACEFCEDRYGCVSPCSMKLIEEEKPADLPKGEDYGIDGLYAAIDILQKTLGEVDGYQTNDGILMHKCAISAVKELSKQKPAWSEEDKDILFRTINNLKFLRDTISIDPKYAINIIDIEREITWLNSLRPQNKTYYWTENEIKFAISDFIRGAESYEKMVEKLRCLKPQSQWKPSGEQMLAINTAINVLGKGTINGKYLIELQEQLKNLMEE